LVEYEGAGRDLVLALKYRNRRQAVPLIGYALASLAIDSLSIVGYGQPSLVTWAPTSNARRRRRGFDQARLLAQTTAAHLGVPAVPLLRRRTGAAQTGSPADQRRRGPSFARSRRGVRGTGPLLIVDDVLTTGSTLRGAAETLQDSGFAPLVGLVLARTALKVATRRADDCN
jgi:predicted amidophosphoribosyltransferase